MTSFCTLDVMTPLVLHKICLCLKSPKLMFVYSSFKRNVYKMHLKDFRLETSSIQLLRELILLGLDRKRRRKTGRAAA